MPFQGFEGPAGTGKTYELIEAARARAGQNQFGAQQRLLALTFMHGSRRRLHERFASHPETRDRAVCMTIDSFAYNVLRRWRSVAGPLPNAREFDRICGACGAILERPEVARWIVATFPVVAIDEAQELSPERLKIGKALADHADMLIAADEFQCLDDNIDTGPFQEWFHAGQVQRLTRVRRTNRPGLLDAALAVRQGRAPQEGGGLRIRYEYPNQAPFAIGRALQNAQGTTAVLVAPSCAQWADALIPRLRVGLNSARQTIPPLRIAREMSVIEEAKAIADSVCIDGHPITADELRNRLLGLAEPPVWVRLALSSIDYARRARGQREWSAQHARDLIGQKQALIVHLGTAPRGEFKLCQFTVLKTGNSEMSLYYGVREYPEMMPIKDVCFITLLPEQSINARCLPARSSAWRSRHSPNRPLSTSPLLIGISSRDRPCRP
jgi:hypothetical protein